MDWIPFHAGRERLRSALCFRAKTGVRYCPTSSRDQTLQNINPMKISRIVLAVLFALAASANTLRAVPSLPTFSFHENGQGKLELPPPIGIVIPLPGVLMSDPGPGGLIECSGFYGTPSGGPLSGGRCGAAGREWPRFRHPAV